MLLDVLQSFVLLKTNLEELDRININFFWNKNLNYKGVNLIGWDKIYNFK